MTGMVTIGGRQRRDGNDAMGMTRWGRHNGDNAMGTTQRGGGWEREVVF
jgi:hypothetical protein